MSRDGGVEKLAEDVKSRQRTDNRVFKFILDNMKDVTDNLTKTLNGLTGNRVNLTCVDKDGGEKVFTSIVNRAVYSMEVVTLKGKLKFPKPQDINFKLLNTLNPDDLVEIYVHIYVNVDTPPAEVWLACDKRYITIHAPRLIKTASGGYTMIQPLTRLRIDFSKVYDDNPGRTVLFMYDFMLYKRKVSPGRDSAFSFQGNHPAENPDSPLYLQAMQLLAPKSTHILPFIISQNTVEAHKAAILRHVKHEVIEKEVQELGFLYYIEFDPQSSHMIACVVNKDAIEIVDTIALSPYHKQLSEFARALQTAVFDRVSDAGEELLVTPLFAGEDAPFLQEYELAQKVSVSCRGRIHSAGDKGPGPMRMVGIPFVVSPRNHAVLPS